MANDPTYPRHARQIIDNNGKEIFGEVSATPTEHTLLWRLAHVGVNLPSSGHTGKFTITDYATLKPILPSASIEANAGITLRADVNNVGNIYIFLNTFDSDGYPLSKDDPPLFVEIDDVNRIYVKADNNDDVLYYIVT